MHAKECEKKYQQRKVGQFKPTDAGLDTIDGPTKRQHDIMIFREQADQIERDLRKRQAAEGEIPDVPDGTVDIKMQDRKMVYYNDKGQEIPVAPVVEKPLTAEDIQKSKDWAQKLRDKALKLQYEDQYDKAYCDAGYFKIPYLDFMFPPPENTRVDNAEVSVKTPVFPDPETLSTCMLPREKRDVDEAKLLFDAYFNDLSEAEKIAFRDIELPAKQPSETPGQRDLRRLSLYVSSMKTIEARYEHLKLLLVAGGRYLNVNAYNIHCDKLADQWWALWSLKLEAEEFNDRAELKERLWSREEGPLLVPGEVDSIMYRLDVKCHLSLERMRYKELITEPQYHELCWKVPLESPNRLPKMLNAISDNIRDWSQYMRLVQTLVEDNQYYLAERLAIPPPTEEFKKNRVDWQMSPMNEQDMAHMYARCADFAIAAEDMEQVYKKLGKSYNGMVKLFKGQPYRDTFQPKVKYPTRRLLPQPKDTDEDDLPLRHNTPSNSDDDSSWDGDRYAYSSDNDYSSDEDHAAPLEALPQASPPSRPKSQDGDSDSECIFFSASSDVTKGISQIFQ
jgi:hypothetical protein